MHHSTQSNAIYKRYCTIALNATATCISWTKWRTRRRGKIKLCIYLVFYYFFSFGHFINKKIFSLLLILFHLIFFYPFLALKAFKNLKKIQNYEISLFLTLKQKNCSFGVLQPLKTPKKSDFIVLALFKGIFRWF